MVLDNGSEDGTEEAVRSFFEARDFPWVFEYSETNLGVGGGRSRVFHLAQGKYVYFLDDDAIIAPESRQRFFMQCVAYMERNPQAASLTTRIYDEMQGQDRGLELSGGTRIDGLPTCFKFLGGSHFLRKSCFSEPLYLNILYGCEEYAPSIRVQDQGFFHVYDDSVRILHQPKVNKWELGSPEFVKVETKGCAVRYASKRLLYPGIFLPVLWVGYKLRCRKYLTPEACKNADRMARSILASGRCKKVRLSTVLRLHREFGNTVL